MTEKKKGMLKRKKEYNERIKNNLINYVDNTIQDPITKQKLIKKVKKGFIKSIFDLDPYIDSNNEKIKDEEEERKNELIKIVRNTYLHTATKSALIDKINQNQITTTYEINEEIKLEEEKQREKKIKRRIEREKEFKRIEEEREKELRRQEAERIRELRRQEEERKIDEDEEEYDDVDGYEEEPSIEEMANAYCYVNDFDEWEDDGYWIYFYSLGSGFKDGNCESIKVDELISWYKNN